MGWSRVAGKQCQPLSHSLGKAICIAIHIGHDGTIGQVSGSKKAKGGRGEEESGGTGAPSDKAMRASS